MSAFLSLVIFSERITSISDYVFIVICYCIYIVAPFDNCSLSDRFLYDVISVIIKRFPYSIIVVTI